MTRAAELLVGSFVGTDGRMANSLVVSMGNGGGSGRQAATPAAHGERPAERGRRRRGDSSSRSPIFKTRARASPPPFRADEKYPRESFPRGGFPGATFGAIDRSLAIGGWYQFHAWVCHILATFAACSI